MMRAGWFATRPFFMRADFRPLDALAANEKGRPARTALRLFDAILLERQIVSRTFSVSVGLMALAWITLGWPVGAAGSTAGVTGRVIAVQSPELRETTFGA